MLIRWGRFGKFKCCSNFPTCKWHDSLVHKDPPEEVGRNCPECGKPLIKRKSRFGNYFIGCSGYPKCRYLEKIEGQEISRKKKKKTEETEEE